MLDLPSPIVNHGIVVFCASKNEIVHGSITICDEFLENLPML